MAPYLLFKISMKYLFLALISVLVISCGQESPLKSVLAQFSQPRGKRITKGPIFENKSAIKGNQRIINPKTPEEFAINEIQDYAEIHKRWSKIGYSYMNDQPDIATAFSPIIYNPKIILDELNYIKKEMPKELLNIYQSKSKFPENRVYDQKLLEYWGKRINGGCDKARRWQLKIAPDISKWTKERFRDVRGFLFFKDLENLQSKLDNFSGQDSSFQEKAKAALINICLNNTHKQSECELEAQDSIDKQKAYPFYENYITKAKEIYDSYFKLYSLNPEVKFIDHVLNVTVTRPKDNFFANYFKDTIDRNWAVGDKLLKELHVNFVDYPKPDQTYIVLNPETVSYVENYRKMVINPTLDDYSLQKTLTHEFGHILGFIDCYVEFYDEIKSEAVYYEIDSQNIMCSLNGHVTEEHYSTLLKTY